MWIYHYFPAYLKPGKKFLWPRALFHVYLPIIARFWEIRQNLILKFLAPIYSKFTPECIENSNVSSKRHCFSTKIKVFYLKIKKVSNQEKVANLLQNAYKRVIILNYAFSGWISAFSYLKKYSEFFNFEKLHFCCRIFSERHSKRK